MNIDEENISDDEDEQDKIADKIHMEKGLEAEDNNYHVATINPIVINKMLKRIIPAPNSSISSGFLTCFKIYNLKKVVDCQISGGGDCLDSSSILIT